MKQRYVIKPFTEEQREANKKKFVDKKREQVEEVLGRKLSDWEWIDYQRMTRKKQK